MNYFEDLHHKGNQLLNNIKKVLPELKELLEKVNGHWYYEDSIYRFYHQSYQVYHIQGLTQDIIEKLNSLAPDGVKPNSFLEEILKEGGSGKTFQDSHNKNWLKHTRPMLEAFFHAKYFLEMAVKYGEKLDEAPTCLPSGWAGLLYFYNLR
jgi:hypothetical protein